MVSCNHVPYLAEDEKLYLLLNDEQPFGGAKVDRLDGVDRWKQYSLGLLFVSAGMETKHTETGHVHCPGRDHIG